MKTYKRKNENRSPWSSHFIWKFQVWSMINKHLAWSGEFCNFPQVPLQFCSVQGKHHHVYTVQESLKEAWFHWNESINPRLYFFPLCEAVCRDHFVNFDVQIRFRYQKLTTTTTTSSKLQIVSILETRKNIFGSQESSAVCAFLVTFSRLVN